MARSPLGRPGDAVLVIGLGRFGSAVAESLVELGSEVLAVDADNDRVQELADRLTHVVQGDASNPDVLSQLGAAEFTRVVVGIGDLEASILTTTALVDLGVREVWAKALTPAHGRILERIGAHHVVFPESEMGRRVAHQVTGGLLDFMAVEGVYALAEVRTSAGLDGVSLRDSRLHSRHGVTVLAVAAGGRDFAAPHPETVLRQGDLLIVAGRTTDVERFAETLDR